MFAPFLSRVFSLVLALVLLGPLAPRTAQAADFLYDSFVLGTGVGHGGFGLDRKPGFALDVRTGFSVNRPSFDTWSLTGIHRLFLTPEVGYSFDTYGPARQHLATVGTGVRYGSNLLHGGWVPRFVAGRSDGERVIGMRNAAVFRFLMLFEVEVSHGWMHGGPSPGHELRGLFTLECLWLFLGVFVD
jgi:hypothetical protein